MGRSKVVLGTNLYLKFPSFGASSWETLSKTVRGNPPQSGKRGRAWIAPRFRLRKARYIYYFFNCQHHKEPRLP